MTRAVIAAAIAGAALGLTPAPAGGTDCGPPPAPPCREAPATTGRADFAVLIALHLAAAEMNCPYRIEMGRLRRLLDQHNLRLGDAYTLSRSAQLTAEYDKILRAFRDDPQKACETAWRSFGPAAVYEGFLQAR